MSEFVFLNDNLADADEAQISVHDTGLLHGVGLFETMRSYNGKVFRLDDHLDRLFRSAAALNITITQSRDEMTAAIDKLLEANQLRDGRLRLTVTSGSIRSRNVGEDHQPQDTLIITAGQMNPYPNELYRYGAIVIISSCKQNPDDPTSGHKVLNFLPRLLALREAQTKKTAEALWFTTTNRLAEGCVSNVFIVHNNKLLTPPLDTPVLPGITRKVVLELARQNDIECEEHELVIKDLLEATEVFLTNSIMELMPLRQVEAHKIADERPGPVYQKLHELYRQAVEQECPNQYG